MKAHLRRAVVRGAGAALTLLKSMMPARALLARASTIPKKPSGDIGVRRAKYRRVVPDPHPPTFRAAVAVVEDEVGVRYGISKDKEEVLRYGLHSVGPPLRWMTLKPFKGPFAIAMIEEIMASIKESHHTE